MAPEKAIVVYDQQRANALRPFLAEGVVILCGGSNPGGRRFDHIVIALDMHSEHGNEAIDAMIRDWYWSSLMTRITPGGQITWLTHKPEWAKEYHNG